MEKASKELLKEFVNSQQFTSTTDIMNSMKELFSFVFVRYTIRQEYSFFSEGIPIRRPAFFRVKFHV